jgi:chemotaxis family two-component system response regulator Rcp1
VEGFNTTVETAMTFAWLCASDSESSPVPVRIAPQKLGAEPGRKIIALLVEDNRIDVLMVEEAIELQGLPIELHVAEDGERACDFLAQADETPEAVKPDVLLLDLNLPKRSGKEVLARLRHGKACKDIPVLIITSSDTARERDELAKLGVAGYFRKPASYDDFMKLGQVLKGVLGGHSALST